jgi:hypothetical protein
MAVAKWLLGAWPCIPCACRARRGRVGLICRRVQWLGQNTRCCSVTGVGDLDGRPRLGGLVDAYRPV